MTESKKISSQEKELKLKAKIEKAKKDLLKLQQKRKLEIGSIACRHGLDSYSSRKLDMAFAKLSQELNNEP